MPLVANGLACLVGLLLAGAAMYRARGLLLLPLSVIIFVLTNGVFQALPVVVDVGVPFPTDPLLYSRVAVVHSIFVGVASLPLLILATSRRRSSADIPVRLPIWLPLGLGALGLASLAYHLLRNPTILSLSVDVYRADSYLDYLSARNAAGAVVASRRFSGGGLVSLAFASWCTTALALLQFVPALARGKRRLLSSVLWLTMLAIALLNGSRMMLFFVVFFPLALLIRRKVNARSLVKTLRASVKPLMLGVGIGAGGVALFQVFFQSTALFAVWMFFVRIFVAPGAVSGGYYLSFPGVFRFRGLGGIFMMPLPSDNVDFSMISLATTGLDSHANASFLATAYSGAGYGGVFIVSLALVVGAYLTDVWLLRLPRRMSSALVFANIFGILSIASVPFAISVVTYGFIIGPFGILLLLASVRPFAKRVGGAPGTHLNRTVVWRERLQRS